VRELLDFSRPSKSEILKVDLNKVIENTLSLISYQKDFRNIETQLELHTNLPRVEGDESQLSQVFINIILNAVDAMPLGGSLRIQTEEYVVEDFFVNDFQRLFDPRRKGTLSNRLFPSEKTQPSGCDPWKIFERDLLVRVRISDTGTGIKKEDLERIFDPFSRPNLPIRDRSWTFHLLEDVESMGGL